jgi:hypothetical protein
MLIASSGFYLKRLSTRKRKRTLVKLNNIPCKISQPLYIILGTGIRPPPYAGNYFWLMAAVAEKIR